MSLITILPLSTAKREGYLKRAISKEQVLCIYYLESHYNTYRDYGVDQLIREMIRQLNVVIIEKSS